MQQLRHLMLYRSRFISSFRHRLIQLDPTSAQSLMHQLLTQKKKLHLSQSQQSKLSQTIIAQKVQSPYKLMQLYEWSKNVMKSFRDEFLTDSDTEEIGNIVSQNQERANNEEDISVNNEQKKVQYIDRSAPINHSFSHIQSQTQKQPNSPQQNPTIIQDFKPQKHLSSNILDKRKLTFKIVKLYHDFFQIQKSSIKAEQIMHVYKKKLCHEAIIVPTIFCWLNDWIAKEFTNFVKQQISELGKFYKNVIYNKKQQWREQKKVRKPFVEAEQQVNTKQQSVFLPPETPLKKRDKLKVKQLQADMFFSIDLDHGKSKQDLYRKIDKISMINKNTIQQTIQHREVFQKQRSSKRIYLQRAEILRTNNSNTDDKNRHTPTSKQFKKLSINPYEISNLLPYKYQTVQQPSKKQPFPNDQIQSSPVNREILIGAFYQRYLNLYRNLQSVLPDLDVHYIKQIKRNDRKPQIKKRIKEIVRVITRNQPIIKSSVEQYQLKFYQRKHKNQKKLKKKKNRYYKHLINNLQNNQITHPSIQSTNRSFIQPATRYSSLDYSANHETGKLLSDKKIKSNRYLQKQTQEQNNLERIYQQNRYLQKQTNEQTNLERIYQQKRQQRQKQVFCLNQPIRFQFNLPSLPKKQRNGQTRHKEQSKIVLIQGGRYKLLESVETKDFTQITNRKKRLSNYSIELGHTIDKPQPVVNNESNESKKIAKIDRRSASILQIITKKKKSIPQDILQISVKEATSQVFPGKVFSSRNRYPNTRSIWNNENMQRQFRQILQNLEENDEGGISAWDKGQETPMMG